ncbi:MAG: zf-HC2 domain-containing protein [Myxococcales bacterium]
MTRLGGGGVSTRHVESERLSAWISGDLTERETAVVRAHVENCAACANVASELRTQVVATRTLERPEPPATLWSAIEGAMARDDRDGSDGRLTTARRPRSPWSARWPTLLTGAFAGAAAVVALTWSVGHMGHLRALGTPGGGISTSAGTARGGLAADGADPLLAEAERELEDAAGSYERAVARLREILEREQVRWDPAARARVGERVARLDEAVAYSRTVARRDPGDGAGADLLFSAYQRQIDFLAEAVHRGAPAAEDGLR